MPTPPLKPYLNPVFVETGSNYGDGIQAALDAWFKEIHSLEIVPEFIDHCQRRFADYNNVYIYQEDSALGLGRVIKPITHRITFFLDAHFTGKPFGRGIVNCPLWKELGHIKNHHRNDHTILIDDMKVYIEESEVVPLLLDINKDYKFSYENDGDVLVARIR